MAVACSEEDSREEACRTEEGRVAVHPRSHVVEGGKDSLHRMAEVGSTLELPEVLVAEHWPVERLQPEVRDGHSSPLVASPRSPSPLLEIVSVAIRCCSLSIPLVASLIALHGPQYSAQYVLEGAAANAVSTRNGCCCSDQTAAFSHRYDFLQMSRRSNRRDLTTSILPADVVANTDSTLVECESEAKLRCSDLFEALARSWRAEYYDDERRDTPAKIG